MGEQTRASRRAIGRPEPTHYSHTDPSLSGQGNVGMKTLHRISADILDGSRSPRSDHDDDDRYEMETARVHLIMVTNHP